jgi:VanZ family protein
MLSAARITAWLLTVVITVLSVVPPQLRPETGLPQDLEHFGIFFAAGLAFGFGYWREPIVVSIALILYAGVIEIAQIFVPGRHARLSDFIVDALALCAGVMMASIFVAQATKLK